MTDADQKNNVSLFLPYQKKWLEDQTEVKICEKSRRIGLSWSTAFGAVVKAAAQKGMDVWYTGYNKDMAVEFINDCAAWARSLNAVVSEIEEDVETFKNDDEDKSILTFSIKFASGFRITALSSAPSNFRGKQGHAIIDEAAFHPNLDELIKAAMAFLIWGGSLEIISTHDGIENRFNELIEETKAGKTGYSHHKITFNEALQQGLYQRICLRSGEEYSQEKELIWAEKIRAFYHPNDAEELDCIPRQSSGTYFSRALVEQCMSKDYPVLTFYPPDDFVHKDATYRGLYTLSWFEDNVLPLIKAIPKNLRCFYGMDFGRLVDLSVIAIGVQESSVKYYSPFFLELRNVPFEQQKQILFHICEHLPIFVGGANDTRGNGHYIGEVAMQQYGAGRIQQVMISQSWYRENMPKYKDAIESKEVTMPFSEDVIDDHRAVQLVNGVPSVPQNIRSTDRQGNKRHGDSAIAGALLKFAINTCQEPFEFYSENPRNNGAGSENFRGYM